jgi:hypothetical protein
MRKIALAMLLLLVSSASAFSLPSTFCSDLFTGTNANNPLLNASSYASLLGISLLVVLMVLTVLGITYAIGMAFKVESLKNFTKSEFLESFFNIVLIVVISSGVALSGSAIAFVTNIGLAGIQSVSSQSASCGASSAGGQCASSIAPAQAVQVTDAKSVYLGICNNYVQNGIDTSISNAVQGQVSVQILTAMLGMTFDWRISGNGVMFIPLWGIFPVVSLVNTQVGIFDAIIGMLLLITFLLYIIYSVFPVFLYVGILLRSFPWTRTAGGTLIAMFIAFYIIFPAILYPFSLYLQNLYGALSIPTSNLTGFSYSAVLAVLPLVSGTNMLSELSGFAQTLATVGLQLMGVLIGLMISLDIVEAIGKLLGAPSTHTRSLLGKLL